MTGHCSHYFFQLFSLVFTTAHAQSSTLANPKWCSHHARQFSNIPAKNVTSIIGVEIFESQIPEHFSLGSLRVKVTTQIRHHFNFCYFFVINGGSLPSAEVSLCRREAGERERTSAEERLAEDWYPNFAPN